MTDEEREAARARIQTELEIEHEDRLARMRERQRPSRSPTADPKSQHREAELAKIRDQTRAKFYRDQGYKQYTDSSGRHVWLPPEEYAWRKKHKSKRRKRMSPIPETGRTSWMAYLGMVIFAVALGLLLAR